MVGGAAHVAVFEDMDADAICRRSAICNEMKRECFTRERKEAHAQTGMHKAVTTY